MEKISEYLKINRSIDSRKIDDLVSKACNSATKILSFNDLIQISDNNKYRIKIDLNEKNNTEIVYSYYNGSDFNDIDDEHIPLDEHNSTVYGKYIKNLNKKLDKMKIKITEVMSDGKERDLNEICNELKKVLEFENNQQVNAICSALVNENHLKQSTREGHRYYKYIAKYLSLEDIKDEILDIVNNKRISYRDIQSSSEKLKNIQPQLIMDAVEELKTIYIPNYLMVKCPFDTPDWYNQRIEEIAKNISKVLKDGKERNINAICNELKGTVEFEDEQEVNSICDKMLRDGFIEKNKQNDFIFVSDYYTDSEIKNEIKNVLNHNRMMFRDIQGNSEKLKNISTFLFGYLFDELILETEEKELKCYLDGDDDWTETWEYFEENAKK